MRVFLVLLLALVPAIAFTVSSFADTGSLGKRPLDLPAGGLGDEDEDEQNPETIVFYGQEVEGDAFFWCFPAYGFCGETIAFTAIKQEITQALTQLSTQAQFSMVAFNSQTYVWSYQSKTANSANKGSALGWMNTLVPIEAHCLKPAALTTLQIAHTAPGQFKRMIQMGARAPYCECPQLDECIAEITGANYENMPINTVYVTSTFYGGEAYFYQQLAAANNGSFQEIDN